MKRNLHTHTTYCDGKDPPEALVLTAIEKGFDTLGFSGHSPLPGAEDWCMSPAGAAAYRAEIGRLKEQYRGRLTILCGVEQDIESGRAPAGYDYVIGSVHSIRKDGALVTVDWTPEHLQAGVEVHWGGDWYAMAEDYYRRVAQVAAVTGADIIGHFDLVTKFNEGGTFFDEGHPRYVAAAQAAALALLEAGKPFEVNTGGIARGWRTDAYPAAPLRDFLMRHGARFLLTSDCHMKDQLDCAFDRFAAYAKGG